MECILVQKPLIYRLVKCSEVTAITTTTIYGYVKCVLYLLIRCTDVATALTDELNYCRRKIFRIIKEVKQVRNGKPYTDKVWVSAISDISRLFIRFSHQCERNFHFHTLLYLFKPFIVLSNCKIEDKISAYHFVVHMLE